MASTWGDSWDDAWGDSWDVSDTPTLPDATITFVGALADDITFTGDNDG